jgi:GAF domain-containing protein
MAYVEAGDDVAFLEQVARQVAIAVENALEYEKAIKDRDKEAKSKTLSRRGISRRVRGDRRRQSCFENRVGPSVRSGADRFQRSDFGRDGNR